MSDGDSGKSKLAIYSMGIVAKNKATNTDIIEVTPIEDLPMISGQLTDNMDTATSSGTDSQGVAYQTQANTTNTITAKWMGVGSPNQATSPDVRRGEMVVIYKFADADADKGFFWVTYKQDLNLRRLETVVYAWSGTSDDSLVLNADNMADNMYYMEVSTHKGHVMLHTSKANNEYASYDIVLDTINGYFAMEDGLGNQVLVSSKENQIYFCNADGSIFDMNKTNLNITIPDTLTIDTKTFKVNATDSTLTTTNNTVTATNNTIDATTVHTGAFTENGALNLNGDMTAAAGEGEGGGGGNITMKGNFTLQGNMTAQGNIRSEGQVSANSIHSDTQSI